MLFTSVVSALSWSGIENSHWSVFACFYSSIVVALVAIVLSNQQETFLRLSLDGSPALSSTAVQLSFKASSKNLSERPRPNRLMIFALQSPMMMFVFATMMFLAGLCSTVYSPLVRKDIDWGHHLKACFQTTKTDLTAFF